MYLRSHFAPFLIFVLLGLRAGSEPSLPYVVGAFLQEIPHRYTEEHGLPATGVNDILVSPDGKVFARTREGVLQYAATEWSYVNSADEPTILAAFDAQRPGAPIRQIHRNADGTAWVAHEQGLFFRDAQNNAIPLTISDGKGRRWATEDVRGVCVDNTGALWVAVSAGVACGRLPEILSGSISPSTWEQVTWRFYEGRDGVPYTDFTCVTADPLGGVWLGTHLGLVCYRDNEWGYRQGRLWLPDDDVRAVAVDANRNVWVATAGGVTCIERKPMTLAEKAAFFEAWTDRFKRTPFGYLGGARLRAPGDTTEFILHDTDNDGLWTAMYGAAQCFAYAVRRTEDHKTKAKQAFEALRHLQKVTQGGTHEPPRGFVARTIRSVEESDPNIGRLERDQYHQKNRDRLWKVYEPRWPRSADGRWFWKSDTSSDELDGHYFFYPLYYDLVAETEEERTRVREVVRDLTDHLITHGYRLVDHDGKPTRWGIFDPESLNNNPDWYEERGLNSLSMLSYLSVAHHITGDPKYSKHIQTLAYRHGYRANAMQSKLHYGPGSGNQSDDEMAFMNFYNLMKYCPDDEIRRTLLYSFFSHWALEFPEMNPFFNFAYAAFGRNTVYENPWGTHDISPWEGWLEDSITTLKNFPLERIGWGHKNSHRADIVRLRRQDAVLPYNPPEHNRGHRVNSKVVPVENRFFEHWNTDPWNLDYGGDGMTVGDGTVFLLPYYMGLYHGFIQD
jgi:hypothetical protein